jgi:hypothetical protein
MVRRAPRLDVYHWQAGALVLLRRKVSTGAAAGN